MSKTEKIGKPSIKDPETGANIELGQPVLKDEFEKESIEATFPVIKEAFIEFFIKRANEGDNRAALMFAIAELKKEKGDATLALSIIESARGELQFSRNLMESYELESEDTTKNQELEVERQKNFEQDMHYQETSDILFGHDNYVVPARSDLIEWLGETKKLIKKLAKEEEEKLIGAEEDKSAGKRIFRSKLLTDLPAIERFETGRETTRDYREIMSLIESRLLAERDKIGGLLMQYITSPKKEQKNDMAKSLAEIRKMELFFAMSEGERNERIAKKQS